MTEGTLERLQDLQMHWGEPCLYTQTEEARSIDKQKLERDFFALRSYEMPCGLAAC